MISAAASYAFAGSTKPLKIVAYGDSLMAGYGLAEADSYPNRLQEALRGRGLDVTVVNAGVSGDTTASGLARFDWAIDPETDAVIIELGANDALRGQSPQSARENLEQIMVRLRDRNIPALLVGMRAPMNWGPQYAEEFERIFPELAEQYDALLYPFFLDGVAMNRELNQPDGIHPNAEGVRVLVERTLPQVEKLIERALARTNG